MKWSLDLEYETPQEWVDIVIGDFNTFLQDHADCERKASAMAMSFVAKCPDKTEIIPELIATALEELEHFQQVYALMEKRGIQLRAEMHEDKYVKQLIGLCRNGRDGRLLDRLLLASIIECRGAERFHLIHKNLKNSTLRDFYKMLWVSEAKHGNIFVGMALNYWPKDTVYKRLDELNKAEGKICGALELRPALH